MAKGILSRPLDLLYMTFLVLHIPPTLLLDAQAVLPSHYFPNGLKAFLANYIATSKDPLLSNIQQPQFAWLRAYMVCELTVQMLVFVAGPLALYKGKLQASYPAELINVPDNRKFWPVLLLYAAHGATTTLACLANISAATYLDSKQYTLLMCSYLPYLLVPIVSTLRVMLQVLTIIQLMATDITSRIVRALDAPHAKQ
jgi:hypothetical protein